MAQASSSWQQLINQLPNCLLPEFKTGSPKRRNLKRFSEPGVILGFLTIIVAMLLWNWKLLLAMGVGIGVMVLAYSMQEWDWRMRWFEIRQFLKSPNRRLVLAVISGGVATVSTYIAAAIWVDSSSPWIAASAIVQGIGTLLTLVLLVWQIISLQENREQDHLDQLLINLTVKDPLKRLITVRQLTKLIAPRRMETSVQQGVVECLRLLLSREEETVVREATFESLPALDFLDSTPSKVAEPLTPLSTKAKARISVPEF